MLKNKSAAHQSKVNEAVRILSSTTGVNVPQAMIQAGFPKKDIANKTIRRMLHCHLEALGYPNRQGTMIMQQRNNQLHCAIPGTTAAPLPPNQ